MDTKAPCSSGMAIAVVKTIYDRPMILPTYDRSLDHMNCGYTLFEDGQFHRALRCPKALQPGRSYLS